MKKEVIEYLTPSLQKATAEELKVIGVGAFGSNFPYLVEAKPEIIKAFKEELKLPDEDYADRMIFHYVITWVEAQESKAVSSSGVLEFNPAVPSKPVTIKTIVSETEKLRKKFTPKQAFIKR